MKFEVTLAPNDVESWPGFEVAIEGTDLSPVDVPIRQLADLLQATAAAFEAVAEGRGVRPEAPRLVAIHAGSAAYDLRTPDRSAKPVIDELGEHIAARGRQSAPKIRHALDRMHRAAKDIGSVRFVPFDAKGRRPKKATVLHLAPVVQEISSPFEAGSEVEGLVVGVASSKGEKLSVKLRLSDGATQEFSATELNAIAAGKLFLRRVRGRVMYEVRPEGEAPLELTELEPIDAIPPESTLAAFEAIKRELAERGMQVRLSDWLREDDD